MRIPTTEFIMYRLKITLYGFRGKYNMIPTL